ncbi:MAG TPA: hypothetical protein VJH96_04480 [Patescibacteria group bacterium]|nr:hypothetical protein [Patescibacteria group bacterium]
MVEREQDTQIPEKTKISRREFFSYTCMVGSGLTGAVSVEKGLENLYDTFKLAKLQGDETNNRRKEQQIVKELTKDMKGMVHWAIATFALGFMALGAVSRK